MLLQTIPNVGPTNAKHIVQHTTRRNFSQYISELTVSYEVVMNANRNTICQFTIMPSSTSQRVRVPSAFGSKCTAARFSFVYHEVSHDGRCQFANFFLGYSFNFALSRVRQCVARACFSTLARRSIKTAFYAFAREVKLKMRHDDSGSKRKSGIIR